DQPDPRWIRRHHDHVAVETLSLTHDALRRLPRADDVSVCIDALPLQCLDRALDVVLLLPPFMLRRPEPRIGESERRAVDAGNGEDAHGGAERRRELDHTRWKRPTLAGEQHATDLDRRGVGWFGRALKEAHGPKGAPEMAGAPSLVSTRRAQ